MKKDLIEFYEKYKDKLILILLALLTIQFIIIYLMLGVDGKSGKIEKLEVEKIINKEKIKVLSDSLRTVKQIKDSYKESYESSQKIIYKYEKTFQLIKSKNNEKIRNLPNLSDVQLDEFFATQEREWSLSQQTKSTGNRP
jgi:hypothetical protein